MIHLSRSPAAFGAALLLLTLGGCGAGGPRSAGQTAPAADGWTARDTVGRAIELLSKGDADQARGVLGKLLKRTPNDAIAAGLLKQIESDPVALLGRESFAYTVKDGETLSDLAGRFLGNPTQFYALGRYNELTFPVTLAAGQSLRIPGEAKVAKPRPAPEKPKAAPAPKLAAPKPETPRPSPLNPARATKLRAAALEQLNRGQVDRAVGLLRQADLAAPGNPLVRRDLDRALRIQRTIHP